MKEHVTITADGAPFKKWLSVHVEAGATDATRSATITFAEPAEGDSAVSENFTFHPGAKVEVKAGGDLVFRGLVDTYTPSFSSNAHIVSVTCRSNAKDAVDSSAVHKTGEFKKKDPKEIGQELLKDFEGVDISSDVELDKVPVHRLSPGSTVFDELNVLTRQQGVLLMGTAEGGLHITKAGKGGRHSGSLTQGQAPVTGASASLSEKHQHSKVHVRGQGRHGKGKDSLRVEHIAENKNIKRHRPLVIIAEGDTDKQRAKKRALNQVQRAQGWSVQATFAVDTWRDKGGSLWDPKKLIYAHSKWLKVDQDMAIKTVSFHATNQGGQGEGGTTAQLSLVDPKALGGDDVKGKSNDAWSVNASDSEGSGD